MGGALFSQPWREMPKSNAGNLDFAKSYRPQNREVTHLRILLHGPVGAGKSSFINSVESSLKGIICVRAHADATQSGTSYTCQYKNYRIQDTRSNRSYSISFNDIMGFEDDEGVIVEDVMLALKGHVEDGYEFNQSFPLREGDEGYNSSPTLQDRVHVLVSVIPANNVTLLSDAVLKKMRDIRLKVRKLGIPQVAILTKVDEACPEVKGDMSNIYKSKYLKQKVDEFSVQLGLSHNCIFLVKNYESETKTKEAVDAPILLALRQIITYGDEFLSNI